MAQQPDGEFGFTLVELLVVTGTLTLLLALSIQSYTVYQKGAYDSSTESSIHNVTSAIQAGLIENDFMAGAGGVWANLQSAGIPSAADVRALLPGYVHPSNMRLSVSYDAWCANGLMGEWCLETMIHGRHCAGNKMYLKQTFHNGTNLAMEWQAMGGC